MGVIREGWDGRDGLDEVLKRTCEGQQMIVMLQGETKQEEGRKERRKERKGAKWRIRGLMFSSTNHRRRLTTGLPVREDC